MNANVKLFDVLPDGTLILHGSISVHPKEGPLPYTYKGIIYEKTTWLEGLTKMQNDFQTALKELLELDHHEDSYEQEREVLIREMNEASAFFDSWFSDMSLDGKLENVELPYSELKPKNWKNWISKQDFEMVVTNIKKQQKNEEINPEDARYVDTDELRKKYEEAIGGEDKYGYGIDKTIDNLGGGIRRVVSGHIPVKEIYPMNPESDKAKDLIMFVAMRAFYDNGRMFFIDRGASPGYDNTGTLFSAGADGINVEGHRTPTAAGKDIQPMAPQAKDWKRETYLTTTIDLIDMLSQNPFVQAAADRMAASPVISEGDVAAYKELYRDLIKNQKVEMTKKGVEDLFSLSQRIIGEKKGGVQKLLEEIKDIIAGINREILTNVQQEKLRERYKKLNIQILMEVARVEQVRRNQSIRHLIERKGEAKNVSISTKVNQEIVNTYKKLYNELIRDRRSELTRSNVKNLDDLVGMILGEKEGAAKRLHEKLKKNIDAIKREQLTSVQEDNFLTKFEALHWNVLAKVATDMQVGRNQAARNKVSGRSNPGISLSSSPVQMIVIKSEDGLNNREEQKYIDKKVAEYARNSNGRQIRIKHIPHHVALTILNSDEGKEIEEVIIFEDGNPVILSGDAYKAKQGLAASPLGGINLNPDLMDLNIRRDGRGVPLPVEFQPMEAINIDGFIPIIINITPVNLPMLLGLVDEDTPFDAADTDESPVHVMELGLSDDSFQKYHQGALIS